MSPLLDPPKGQLARRWAEILALFVGSYVLLFATSPAIVGVYDEGLILTGAMRVLNGELPSRDFYANYGPAQFVVLAGMFRWLGPDLLVARIYDTFLAATIVPLVWISLSSVRNRWLSSACVLAVLGLLIWDRGPLAPITPAIGLVLLGSLVLIRCLSKGWTLLGYLGLALSMTALMLFRYDLAVLAAGAFGAPFAVITYLQVRDSALARSQAMGIGFRAVTTLAAAMLLALAMLWALGILMPAMSDILVYNTKNYAAMRSLPFPGLRIALWDPHHFFWVYFALGAVSVAAATLMALYRRRRQFAVFSTDPRVVAIAVFACAALFLYAKGLVRTQPGHLLLANVPAVLAFGISLDALDSLFFSERVRILRKVLWPGVFAIAIGYLGFAVRSNAWSHPLYREYGSIPIPSNLSALRVFGAAPDQVRVAQYLAAHTQPSDRIVSATGRHDKVFVNDCAIYFIAQRLPGTRWHHYDPGVQTTQAVQDEMVREIAENRVALILRNSFADSVEEPNQSRFSSGVRILDRYIDSHFHKVAEIGKVEIWAAGQDAQPVASP